MLRIMRPSSCCQRGARMPRCLVRGMRPCWWWSSSGRRPFPEESLAERRKIATTTAALARAAAHGGGSKPHPSASSWLFLAQRQRTVSTAAAVASSMLGRLPRRTPTSGAAILSQQRRGYASSSSSSSSSSSNGGHDVDSLAAFLGGSSSDSDSQGSGDPNPDPPANPQRAPGDSRGTAPPLVAGPASSSWVPPACHDASFVDDTHAPDCWKNALARTSTSLPPAVVYKDAISEEEAQAIADEIRARFRRRRYEPGHWDSVITHYKEIELVDLHRIVEGGTDEEDPHDRLSIIATTFSRLRKHLEDHHLSPPVPWLPCHAIDLSKDGALHAHVDSVRFSGGLVAGLSLQSPAVMRLKHPPKEEDGDEKETDGDEEPVPPGYVDLYLPPRSLYALTGIARYELAHELLPDGATFRHGDEMITVPRSDRLSVIFRDAKPEATTGHEDP